MNLLSVEIPTHLSFGLNKIITRRTATTTMGQIIDLNDFLSIYHLYIYSVIYSFYYSSIASINSRLLFICCYSICVYYISLIDYLSFIDSDS